MDIDGLPPTPSTSRPSTSTSRPSSAGVKLPGIRTLPGFQMQHDSAPGYGLGSSSGLEREWSSIRDREREDLRDREALREMEREREFREREREQEREASRVIGSGTGGGFGYDGYGGGRAGLGKERERELSLPMQAPVSRPLSMSSSSALAMSMTDERPRSRGFTSSATLNSILSVPGPPEPFVQPRPLSSAAYPHSRPLSSASSMLSSPSPFTHGGLPPIGHGLLPGGRKTLGGTTGEMSTGAGTNGGRWAQGQGMSPTLAARPSPISASSAGSSSLAHLYAAASASGPFSASTSASAVPTMSASRPSSSHASSALGINGYGYGRSRTDSNASVNTHTSGSMTPTSHHRMPMPMSPPTSVSTLSHPRPQAYAAPPPSHRAVMSPPPLPPSRQHQHQHQDYRAMSPPASASTPAPASRRGNVNPYLVAQKVQSSPPTGSPYIQSPQLENRRLSPMSPPVLHNQSSLSSRAEARSVPVSPPLGSTGRYQEEPSRAHVSTFTEVAVEKRERVVEKETEKENERRDILEQPTTKEVLRMDVDVRMQEVNDETRPSSSRMDTISSSSVAAASLLEVPSLSTPKTRHDTLRPPSSSPRPRLPSSSPAEASSPSNRAPLSPNAAQTSTSHPHPSSSQLPVIQDTPIPPADTLIPDDSIRCICGISIDDGFSIACDVCSRWCHTACFRIGQESVPEEWVCWVCASSSPNPSNGHTAGGGGRGKGRGKGKGTGAGAASRQWKSWTKEEVEERRVWARQMQMERLGLMEAPGGGLVRAGSGGVDGGGMLAPPADVSGTTGKRKRRASAVPQFQPQQAAHQPQQEGANGLAPAQEGVTGNSVEGSSSANAGVGAPGVNAAVPVEEEDEEPWTSTYVSITQDVITDPETRARLRRHAQRWRGVSALAEDGDDGMDVDGVGVVGARSQRPVRVETVLDPDAPNVTVRPLAPLTRGGSAFTTDGAGPSTSTLPPNPNADGTAPTVPPSSLHTLASASFAYNPLVLPPSYGLHTTSSIPSKALIAPFVSHITSSSTYLSDPLNAYVHLGMPKPYVHLLGPPLEVALDARGVGGKARFARRGCWPNAVVRPVLCDRGKTAANSKGKEKEKSDDGESEEDDGTQLAFGVFALRDLKAGEEVVLGWEWDDGHVVHKLPALLQTPSIVGPAQVPHIKDQMANLLHALASNFVACACGARVQLGEGCTGHHDQREEQHSAQSRREHEHEHGYYYDAESNMDIPYEPQEEMEEPPRGRTRERLSVREKRMRQKEKQQACVLASMARFVGQDDRPHEHSHSRYAPNHTGGTEEVDLGPLVGSSVKRGVRTREGRFGGVENVQSVYGDRERGQSRQNGDVKGRGRGEKSQRYDNTGLNGDADPRNGRHATSRQSTSVQEPRPPDARLFHPTKPSKAANGTTKEDETRMPPKMRMRKRWTHTHEQGEVSQAHAKADNSALQHRSMPATSREVGSMDVDDDTVLQVKENGKIGLGIRLEVEHAPASIYALARDPSPQPIPPTTPPLDADKSTKSTPTMSQTLMPPPPLPTLRDTATATLKTTSAPSEPALVSLPVIDATWSNDVPRSPPRSPGSPIIVPSPSLPRPTSASSDGETQTSGPTPPPPSSSAPLAFPKGSLATTPLINSPSPLVSFANLSLLSPAILSQVRMHAQHPHVTRASLQGMPGPSSSPPISSLASSSSLTSSYFPVHPTATIITPAILSQLHPHPESSPSTFSFENMDLNRTASASPTHTTKDGKDWDPLQRRAAESLVRMSESRRSSASDVGAPREPSPLPLLTQSSSVTHTTLENVSSDEAERVAPSKDLMEKDTCEAGVRIEYSSLELSTNHAPCAEVDEKHFVSLEEADVDMRLSNVNPGSRSTSPAIVAEPLGMDVEVEGTQEPAPAPAPESEPEASLSGHEELQSEESEDLDFPSHRWKRKRKRIVSMDSEAGGRSQSPPYKVARDSAMLGVDVHTSPRPHRERNIPLPAILVRASAVDEDAVMEDIQAGPAEEEEQAEPVRTISPISASGAEPVADEYLRRTKDSSEAEFVAIGESAPSPGTDMFLAESGAALGPSESVAAPSAATVPAPEPSPQPEAPRKVKLSLADFARRKKQQRQEEERQLELQKALNPRPPPASPPPPTALAIVTKPTSNEPANEITEQAMDTSMLVNEAQRHSTPVTDFPSANPQSQILDMVEDAPILDTTAFESLSVNGTGQKDLSAAPSPMSVSPEETAPPLITFVLPTSASVSTLPSPPSPPIPDAPTPQLNRKVTKFSPSLNGSIPEPAPHSVPASISAPLASSSPSTSSMPTPAPEASDQQERQAKQERIEALIPPPPPPSGKPSRFGPPLTRPLVGHVVHPAGGKSSVSPYASGRAGSLDQPLSYVHEKIPLPPHIRRQSQAQEDGEIRENVPPASPTPTPQSTKHTWFGRPLPDPPPDPKDLKGWNQYYREVYNLTGSFDPPGVAVRPGMHPPPKGPRSLNLKGEPITNVNGNMAGQTVPLVSGAPSRSSLPIPTGPRFGIRPGARAPIPDDATRAALAKAKVDVEPSALTPPASVSAHLQSPVVAPGPPPLSARIGPPVPRGASVDYGERDGREDGDRRGGRDYRPYARGRGRGGGVWRK